jgi:hypothetical protein
MNNETYRKVTLGLIAAWFVFALVASSQHLYVVAGSAPPIGLGLGVLTPIVIFLAWVRLSREFRSFLLSLDTRALTLIHSWRFVGFTFITLYTYGLLPGVFAMPAGWGDILMGATAPYAAKHLATPERRNGFIAWQLLGMFDLVIALATAMTSRFITPDAPSMAPMSMLPLSLVPTFGVPLLLILHIISIMQARQWQATAQVGSPVPSAAI